MLTDKSKNIIICSPPGAGGSFLCSIISEMQHDTHSIRISESGNSHAYITAAGSMVRDINKAQLQFFNKSVKLTHSTPAHVRNRLSELGLDATIVAVAIDEADIPLLAWLAWYKNSVIADSLLPLDALKRQYHDRGLHVLREFSEESLSDPSVAAMIVQQITSVLRNWNIEQADVTIHSRDILGLTHNLLEWLDTNIGDNIDALKIHEYHEVNMRSIELFKTTQR